MIERPHEQFNEAVSHRLTNRLDDCGAVIEKLWHSGYQNPWSALLRGNLALDRGQYENAQNWHSLAWEMTAPQGVVRHEYATFFQDIALAYAYSRMRLGWWDSLTWKTWETGRIGKSWNLVPNTRPWEGSADKMIVLSEGGYGDAFLFTRFFQKMDPIQRAASRFVMGPKFAGLKGFLPEWDGMKTYFPDDPISWQGFRYSTALMSLMAIMGIRSTDDIPPQQGGIGERAQHGFLNGSRCRFGLCWQAEENGVQKRIRSIDTWDDLEPIARWEFANLCPGKEMPSAGWENDDEDDLPVLINYPLKTWTDTARLMLTLDCVVTVDTAVAHLAGLIRVPCLLVLPLAVDWKWGASGETTFWWPTVRLIRNTSPFSFKPAMDKVAEILEKW